MGPSRSTTSHAATLVDRYEQTDGTVLMSGSHAIVRLLLDQRRVDRERGLDTAGFVTGYPGSPLAGLDLELARRRNILEHFDIVHRPGLNEELAATAIAGSQLSMLQPDHTRGGVFALWYGKAPGLDRAGDAMRHGNLMGTGPTGGVLVCVGDDPLAKSSSVPSTSEPTLYSLGMPILSPSDPQEILDLGLHGFQLSRSSGLWVGMRIAASSADASQSVDVDAQRTSSCFTPYESNGSPFVHRVSAHLLGAKLIELEESLYGDRIDAARHYGVVHQLNRVTHRGDNDVLGLVAAGPTYLALMHALQKIGLSEGDLAILGIRVFKVAMPFPMDTTVVRDFAQGLREILVVEDKRAFLELFVKEALFGMTNAPAVVGKHDQDGRTLLSTTGELDADAIAIVLAERIGRHRDCEAVGAFRTRTRPPRCTPLSVVRGAYFCSGCPHNTSVRLPSGAYVGSGSGCHGLAIQMDQRQVGTVVGRFQMGGEGAMWNGMSPFVATEHFFQNIGDGTLAHSGSLAIRAAVASGVNITFKVLVNSTVAMTGGQNVFGGRSLDDLVHLLQAEGVRRIIVTTDNRRSPRYAHLPTGVEVLDRSRLVDAEETLAATPGVTVLLHDQECAAELRRKRRRGLLAAPAVHVVVNTRVCEHCGDCGAKSNCLSVRSVDTAFGTKTQIHQESCNFDYSCLAGDCPALISVRSPRRSKLKRDKFDVDVTHLPAPTPRFALDGFTARLSGIGGTGVLTAAQVVAMAAHLQGLYVRGMDQTGIAQKGGAVVSDLRISTQPVENVHRLGEEECDLFLGCDLLVAADPKVLAVASSARTFAVVSTSKVPTGRQVADSSIEFPDVDSMRGRIESRVLSSDAIWLDALALSHRHLGSDSYANVLLLGAAYQVGALVLEVGAIEEAIRLNGVDVDENLRAFRLGRTLAHDRALLGASVDDPIESTSHMALDDVVRIRVDDLRQYQDDAYARTYTELVTEVRAAEASLGVDDEPMSRAVAVQLHRLMTYKDEYEVARLHLDPSASASLKLQFGEGARVTYHLLPPFLERLGRSKKIDVSWGASAIFTSLRALKFLRGTTFDPFGHTASRRLDRQLRDDFIGLVRGLISDLTPANHQRSVETVNLASKIRGFGSVRALSIDSYQDALRDSAVTV